MDGQTAVPGVPQVSPHREQSFPRATTPLGYLPPLLLPVPARMTRKGCPNNVLLFAMFCLDPGENHLSLQLSFKESRAPHLAPHTSPPRGGAKQPAQAALLGHSQRYLGLTLKTAPGTFSRPSLPTLPPKILINVRACTTLMPSRPGRVLSQPLCCGARPPAAPGEGEGRGVSAERLCPARCQRQCAAAELQ